MTSLDGILASNMKIGVVSSVSAQLIKANLAHAGNVSGQYLGQNIAADAILTQLPEFIDLPKLTVNEVSARDFG
ncbi:hypothetical protein GE543_01240 [Pseudomonas sp. SZ57]|uniref:Uncharacterized protein n=1 Tax=Pseudomonas syringae pv. lapsa TaxID=199201 RepID=A0AB74A5F2_PSESX|nr:MULTISPECIES: hypothetical protein [Pseudomonas]ALU60757.1 hypothetical protein ACA40_13110 [Pseudomonas syringae pv. lapsa]MQQ33014.1 hypothetical protein [Pseudomonas sp. SZ57]RML25401.1 hypothetical protein ALQ98_02730 [Pseudomonas syringae pv. lapsa]RMN71325.1 hypothetical protein ALQ54_04416 [Pseudomonas syringae]